MYINKFSLTCDPETEGYPSEKITDGWIYVNGEEIGVFELPALVPVLQSGEADIIVLPGIKENGISGIGVIYPFYKGFTTTISVAETETDTLYPSTSYYPEDSFILAERFELGNAFSPSAFSDTSFVIVTDPADVFEGSRSIKGVLEGGNYFFRSATYPLTLPEVGNPVYMELDYKGDTAFEVWIEGTDLISVSSRYVITVSPKEDWNKIYVNLYESVQALQKDTYKLEIRFDRTDAVPSASVFIDNVKIVADF
ncbi:MAG: hypothetical protein H7X71_05930 [Chitinophagales bacterium]|nr:hypothetical protein [Chitinophagales bacterium]